MSSSTTSALSRQPLAQVLRNITDPRDRRGVRHSLFTVLSLAVTGVLAGCRSLTAIWEHTTDLTPSDLRSLGLEAGQALPSESTIRRVLQDLDPTDLNTRLRSWLCTRTGTVEGRTVIAVDGKTVRGARPGQASAPHLLSALDHATGAVLTQARVANKSPTRGPRHQRASRAPRPRRGSGHRRRHAHTGGHRPVDPRSGRPLRAHRQRQPEDSAQDAQGPALEEGPVRLERRCRPRAAGAAHRPRPSRHPSGWTSPQRLRFSRSDVPGPSRAGSTLRWHT